MNLYTAGLVFTKDAEMVLLIRKARPNNQARKLNAIGGRVQLNESELDCQIRKFREETGLTIVNWDEFMTLEGEDYKVTFFRAKVNLSTFAKARAITDEEVVRVYVNDLAKSTTLPDIQWIIPLALNTPKDRIMRVIEKNNV